MKLVFENELYKFYENEVTKLINEYCVRGTVYNTPPLEDCMAFIAERKADGYRTFILYQGDTPIYANQQLEAMGAHIDMFRFNLKR